MSFASTDASLLQSILFGCGSSSITLNAILHTAASLDHQPLTFDEFDGGIARLMVAGLVDFDGHLVTPTTEAVEMGEQAMRAPSTGDHFHERLVELLDFHYEGQSSLVNATTGWLSPSEFDQAFA